MDIVLVSESLQILLGYIPARQTGNPKADNLCPPLREPPESFYDKDVGKQLPVALKEIVLMPSIVDEIAVLIDETIRERIASGNSLPPVDGHLAPSPTLLCIQVLK